MNPDDYQAALDGLAAGFERLRAMTREPVPPNPPPLKGPSVFPRLVEIGLVHDEIEPMPVEWRDPLITNTKNEETTR